MFFQIPLVFLIFAMLIRVKMEVTVFQIQLISHVRFGIYRRLQNNKIFLKCPEGTDDKKCSTLTSCEVNQCSDISRKGAIITIL